MKKLVLSITLVLTGALLKEQILKPVKWGLCSQKDQQNRSDGDDQGYHR